MYVSVKNQEFALKRINETFCVRNILIIFA